MSLAHTNLPRCPRCGFLAEFRLVDSVDLPYEVRCLGRDCDVSIRGTDELFVVELWRCQARIPREGAEGGFEIIEYDAAEEPTAPKDPRLRGLVDVLHEIEAGGPSGAMFPTWGPTKMRDRAREALVAAGLFRESARRRFEREQHNRLQAGGYE